MTDSAKLSTLIQQAHGKGESLRRHFIRSVLGTAGIGVMQRGLSLLTAIVLARGLGADGYGYYSFAIAAVGLISVLTQFGLPTLLTREVAASHARGDWSLMRGMRQRATQLAVIAVMLSMTIIGGALLVLPVDIAALDPATFVMALVLLPLGVAMQVANSLLMGLRLIIHASWPSSTLQPLIFLLIVLALLAWAQSLRPPMAISANIVGHAAAFLATVYLLRRHWPKETSDAQPTYRTGGWLRSLVPFSLLACTNVINEKTDVLMLGVMTTAEDVGTYNIAFQGSMLVTFALGAFNAVLGPNVARLNAQGARQQLQRLLTLSTAGMAIVAGVTALFLFVAGEWLLEKVFGAPYVQAYSALCILMIGALINSAMGSVGLFLSMTGHEKDTLRALVLSAITNVVLNAVLIPKFGIVGAASATAASVALWNVILGIQLYRRLDLVPGPLYFKVSRHQADL